MTFRPAKWILYSPVALLPLLAALVINGESIRAGNIVQGNWVWLLTALGLGIWFGWATAARKDAP
jgi:hypothetical protein